MQSEFVRRWFNPSIGETGAWEAELSSSAPAIAPRAADYLRAWGYPSGAVAEVFADDYGRQGLVGGSAMFSRELAKRAGWDAVLVGNVWERAAAATGQLYGDNVDNYIADAAGARALLDQFGASTPATEAALTTYVAERKRYAEQYRAQEDAKAKASLLKFVGGLAAVALPGVLGLYPGQGAAAAASSSTAAAGPGFNPGYALDASVIGSVAPGVNPASLGAYALPSASTVTQAASSVLDVVRTGSSSSTPTAAGGLQSLTQGANTVRTLAGAGAAVASAAGLVGGSGSSGAARVVAPAAADPLTAGTASSSSLLVPLGLTAAAVVAVVLFAKRKR